MSKTPSPARRESVAVRFRREIEAAEAAGAARADMRLRLTLNDATRLQRDSALALADLAFSDGEMRYLGVLVEKGGVGASMLVTEPAQA